MTPNHHTEPELHRALQARFRIEKSKLPPMEPVEYQNAIRLIAERLGIDAITGATPMTTKRFTEEETQGVYSHLSPQDRAIQGRMDALYLRQQKHHPIKVARLLSDRGTGYTGKLTGQPGAMA